MYAIKNYVLIESENKDNLKLYVNTNLSKDSELYYHPVIYFRYSIINNLLSEKINYLQPMVEYSNILIKNEKIENYVLIEESSGMLASFADTVRNHIDAGYQPYGPLETYKTMTSDGNSISYTSIILQTMVKYKK